MDKSQPAKSTWFEELQFLERTIYDVDEDEQDRLSTHFLFGEGRARVSPEDFETYFLTRNQSKMIDSVFYRTMAWEYFHLPNRNVATGSPEGFRIALKNVLENEETTSLREIFDNPYNVFWLLNVSLNSPDDFHVWLGEILVKTSNESQDTRLSEIFQYLYAAASFEKSRGPAGNQKAIPVCSFEVSEEPFGPSSTLQFSSRALQIDSESSAFATDIQEVQFGTTHHTKHSGIFQSQAMFRTITIFIIDGSRYTRYEKMGETESEINSSRRSGQTKIEELASIYPVTTGENHVSASGRQVSVGMGWWF
jgi:hypothetical protein